MKKETAEKIQKSTRALYNNVAEHYAVTRNSSRENVKKLLEKYVPKNSELLDVGSAHGNLIYDIPDNVKYTGIDVSDALIGIAKKNFPQKKFYLYDGEHLPFEKNTFETTVMIATLHHIPGEEKRKKLLKELLRVLKKEGKVIITVWKLWEIHFFVYLLKNIFNKIIGKSKIDWFDIKYPWKGRDGKIKGMRYHHMFTLHELEKISKEAGLSVVEKGTLSFNKGKFKNYFIVLEK